MRQIDIRVPRQHYAPGESVRGEVVVKCDEPFNCNRLSLLLLGTAETRIKIRIGDSYHTCRETEKLVDEYMEFCLNTEIPEGESTWPFEFQLPEDLLPSYIGSHGEVSYKLYAKAEVSWALDPARQVRLWIRSEPQHIPPKPMRSCLEAKSGTVEVELPRDVLSLGEPLPVRIMLRQDPRIRGVRFELRFTEWARAEGHERTTRRTTSSLFVKKDELSYESWATIPVETSDQWPPVLDLPFLKTSYSLKVTADIPWAFDRSKTFPLRVGASQRDAFEDSDFDFGIEAWQ
ncbi:MAG: hypothetical protein ACTSPE_07100 [Candidatus Thorarchaeota archaeon]